MFPDVRQNLDVRYLDYARPRGDIRFANGKVGFVRTTDQRA